MVTFNVAGQPYWLRQNAMMVDYKEKARFPGLWMACLLSKSCPSCLLCKPLRTKLISACIVSTF
jgi:hypothetical protein